MSYQDYLSALKLKALEIRKAAIESITAAGSGSTGSTLSAVDILVALYYGQAEHGPFMNIDVTRPGFEGQDYFVLSKGQAAPALYAILADLHYFSETELLHYRQAGAMLSAVPKAKTPGVIVSSGQAGQGLAAAVGLAMALKAERLRNQVFVLVGDAEMATGQVWEALLQAGHNKLGNLVVLVDRNVIQFDGIVRNVNVMDPISEKFDACGFRSINVFAGHDFDQLLDAFQKALSESRLPTAIICKTVKGKGVDFAENKSFYHDTPLSKEELDEAVKSLQRKMDSMKNLSHHE